MKLISVITFVVFIFLLIACDRQRPQAPLPLNQKIEEKVIAEKNNAEVTQKILDHNLELAGKAKEALENYQHRIELEQYRAASDHLAEAIVLFKNLGSSEEEIKKWEKLKDEADSFATLEESKQPKAEAKKKKTKSR